MLLIACSISVARRVLPKAARMHAALLALHVAEVLARDQAPVLGVVGGVATLEGRPPRLLPLGVHRERPHLEPAPLGVVVVGPRPGTTSAFSYWGSMKKFGNRKISPPQSRMPSGRGAQRDPRTGGVVEQRLDRRGRGSPLPPGPCCACPSKTWRSRSSVIASWPSQSVARPVEELVGPPPLRHAALRRVGARLEPRVAVLERGVLGVVDGVVLAEAVRELRVRGHHVVALVERLLGHLPVGVDHRLLPPPHPHVLHADRVEERGDRRQRLPQRAGVGIHVDPHAARPTCRPGTPAAGGRRVRRHSGANPSAPYTNELVPSRFQRQPWNGHTIWPPGRRPVPLHSCVAR